MAKILLCFCANTLCFLDRVNISIAAPFIMAHYGWDERQMGIVLAAFFGGYVLFMIPGGVLADRIGPPKVLTAGVGIWSLFTLLTPCGTSIAAMSAYRFLIGTGQSVNYPCVNHLIAHHVPPAHRVKAQGFTLSGNTAGAALGLPLGSWIIAAWGWPAIFYVFGVLGFIWIVFWLAANRTDPIAPEKTTRRDDPIPWGRLLTHPSALGLTLSYFCHNYTAYMFMAWLPTYLIKVHGLSLAATGIGAMVPALVSGIFMNLSGWLADALIKRGVSREFSRRLLLLAGMGTSGMLLISLPWMGNPYLILAVLSLSSAARSVAFPIYWALSVDMAPRHAGVLASIMNTSGNVAGIVSAAFTGWIVASWGAWHAAIYLCGATTLLGVLIAAPTIRTGEIA